LKKLIRKTNSPNGEKEISDIHSNTYILVDFGSNYTFERGRKMVTNLTDLCAKSTNDESTNKKDLWENEFKKLDTGLLLIFNISVVYIP